MLVASFGQLEGELMNQSRTSDQDLLVALGHCARIASGAEDGKYRDIKDIALSALAKSIGITKAEAGRRVTVGTHAALWDAKATLMTEQLTSKQQFDLIDEALATGLNWIQSYDSDVSGLSSSTEEAIALARHSHHKAIDALAALRCRAIPEMPTHLKELETALRGLYWDNVDYLTLNKLGGMQNHWMRAARVSLGMDVDDVRPAQGKAYGKP